MQTSDDHPDFFMRTIGHEVTSIEHREHPTLEMLFDAASDDASAGARSKLSAHLVTCEQCRTRWRRLTANLQEEAQVLQAESRVPALNAHIPATAPSRSAFSQWLRLLFETRGYVLVAASAAVVALTLSISIPLMRAPALRTSEEIQSLAGEIEHLQNQLSSFTGPANTLLNNVVTSSGPTAEDLASFDWENTWVYFAMPGETWETIAESQLGDRRLWPLIWLLNRDSGPPEAPPADGAPIRLPSSVESRSREQ